VVRKPAIDAFLRQSVAASSDLEAAQAGLLALTAEDVAR
jgi:hypothetical protein